ncbi:DUF1292 domain-containing protein [Microaceticoccus formicicus]|uniref:DUF1292 domain-containing protein n=1 Tax=Microaceticoccus formicicus TaxID=3118105 RepID=UPI003CD029F6|nr:DUF1292 domain-containing protein [Peptoniphilaceae bacterium AMB_02]
MKNDDKKLNNHNCAEMGCDHDHFDQDFEDIETIMLTLNDDSELECVVLGIFDLHDKEYIALVTIDDEQVLLYRYLENGDDSGDFTLENIESDEEFDEVSRMFFEIFGDDEELETE